MSAKGPRKPVRAVTRVLRVTYDVEVASPLPRPRARSRRAGVLFKGSA